MAALDLASADQCCKSSPATEQFCRLNLWFLQGA